MKETLNIFYNTPWKIINESLMYFIKPFVLIYLKICGAKIGSGSKFYGFPLIYKCKGSRIEIGKNFECRNWWFSNPLGINHPTILCTWERGAVINIGDDVGISGGSIVAAKKIQIGDRVLIGANSAVVDTDFHPTSGVKRYSKRGIKVKAVKIGNDVFIGMNCIVLKGTIIKDRSLLPAGKTAR